MVRPADAVFAVCLEQKGFVSGPRRFEIRPHPKHIDLWVVVSFLTVIFIPYGLWLLFIARRVKPLLVLDEWGVRWTGYMGGTWEAPWKDIDWVELRYQHTRHQDYPYLVFMHRPIEQDEYSGAGLPDDKVSLPPGTERHVKLLHIDKDMREIADGFDAFRPLQTESNLHELLDARARSWWVTPVLYCVIVPSVVVMLDTDKNSIFSYWKLFVAAAIIGTAWAAFNWLMYGSKRRS